MFNTIDDIPLLKNEAEMGITQSQYELGMEYWSGELVEQNYETAVLWLKKAIKKKHPSAFYFLGIAYFYGKGVYGNYERSFYHFKQSAILIGHAGAYLHIAKAYEFGLGVKQDYEKAKYWYELAAKKDREIAFLSLGLMYLNTRWKSFNPEKAFFWIHNAAEKFNIEAMIRVALMYKNGEGIEVDMQKSIEWLELASNQDQGQAKYIYGKICNLEIFDTPWDQFMHDHSFRPIIKDLKKQLPKLDNTSDTKLFR